MKDSIVNGIDGYTTQSVLEGRLERDHLGIESYVKVGGYHVKYWVFPELAKFRPGQRIRVTIEAIA